MQKRAVNAGVPGTAGLRISPAIHRRIKVAAALEGRPIYDVANELLGEGLDARDRKSSRARVTAVSRKQAGA